MGKYGDASIRATKCLAVGAVGSPQEAWRAAVRETFPDSPSSREKSCPKGTYLGLCEAGIVKGIPAGKYTRSTMNKMYALAAYKLLRDEPGLAGDESALWAKVMDSESKASNGQMDVVIALWRAGLLSGTSGDR